MSEGLIDDEENFRYLIKLLVKLREMELTRQYERDQADYAEKHPRKGGSYYGRGEAADQRAHAQVLTNEHYVYFSTIDAR